MRLPTLEGSLLLLLALIAGCGPEQQVVSPSRSASSKGGLCKPFPSAHPPSGIQVSLTSDPLTQNGVLSLTLDIQNSSAEVIDNLGTRQEYDLLVESESGEVIAQWGLGKTFELALERQHFLPRKVVSKSATWRPKTCAKQSPLSAGKYFARGLWVTVSRSETTQTTRGWWSNRVEFNVS
jgi:hypothetical protein